MKHRVAFIIGLVVGGLLGFFGVLLSVFGDASAGERFSLIAILLAIYLVLGAVWGYLVPQFSWRWGLVLSSPGCCCWRSTPWGSRIRTMSSMPRRSSPCPV